jgi:MFS family permease
VISERHGWKGKIGYVVMGSWHTLLQLTVPVLWTLSVYYLFNSQDISTLKRIFTPKGVWLVLLPVFILLVAYWVFRWIGIRFVDRNDRKRLFATWIVFGLVMIGLPALYLYFLKQSVGLPHTFIQMTYTLLHMSPWKSLGLCIVAAIIGVFMSCVWFGWYLAVALLFNGHNNEAGGAARLQGYKQFMRIRLRQDDLTAYVIGFDKAQPEGRFNSHTKTP